MPSNHVACRRLEHTVKQSVPVDQLVLDDQPHVEAQSNEERQMTRDMKAHGQVIEVAVLGDQRRKLDRSEEDDILAVCHRCQDIRDWNSQHQRIEHLLDPMLVPALEASEGGSPEWQWRSHPPGEPKERQQ